MHIEEKNTESARLGQLIPEEILEDIPHQKAEEFQRGILLYLEREKSELYRKTKDTEEWPEELQQQLCSEIRHFAAIVKASPHNEAKAFTERFCSKTKFRKRRNTVYISSFLNRRIGAKDPVKAADELCGVT